MAQEISSTVVKIPEDIICPITSQIMTDPVILMESGNTYECEAILAWLKSKKTDPLTNEQITVETIAPNRTVKRMITSFLEAHKNLKPELIEDTYLPESLIKSLIEAIQKNDSKAFIDTLGKDSRLLSKDLKDNKNLLMLGCELASLEILTIVIEKLGNTLLKLPCLSKDKGLSLFLTVSRRLGFEGSRTLYKAFQWEISDIQALLSTAVNDNDLVIAKIVLSLGASANLELLNQGYAAKKTEMTSLLISAGAPVNEKDKAGNDFLMRTIQDNYSELSLFLLSQTKDKVNPVTTNSAKETALHTAVENKQFEVVSALLTHPKINIHQLNAKNDTALHTAVRSGNLKMAELLIKNKAALNAKTAQRESVLDIAYKNKHIEMQKLLINTGAEIDDLLFKAIETEQKELIQFLLTQATDKSDINLSNSKGQSALMLAAEKNQSETVALLLNHQKINIHQTDLAGNKALHYAAAGGHQECVKLLMKKGCSIKDKNHAKKTPLQLVQEKGHQALSSWMEGKHRVKKIKPFIKPLKLEIENQKEKLGEQERVIKNQQVEIENLKKQVSVSKNTEKMIQENLSFFTPNRKEMIVEQEKERLRNQEEQRRREEEQKYQAARERERQEQQRKLEIQIKQEPLIAALLKGDIEEVKKLESQGASFEYPNKEGLYPLVAAVYGTNLECVRYVEGKLKGEATKQWSEVDINKALEKLNSQRPTDLPPNATYGDLGNWYLKHHGSTWCASYDSEVLSAEGCNKWYGDGTWGMGGRAGKLIEYPYLKSKKVYAEKEGVKIILYILYAPSVEVHDNVVKTIREQLNELRNDVETKVKQSQSTAKRF